MDSMPEKIDSNFRFVLLSARRAEQIIRGARPKVESPGRKPTSIAMQEVLHDAVEWDYGPPPVEEQPAEEVEPTVDG